MTGIVVSDSILIVEFVGSLRREGMTLKQASTEACKVRLRPILMTTMATILGLIPMALALEPGSEQYAPLARAILGGLTVSGLAQSFWFQRHTCSFIVKKSTPQLKVRLSYESNR